MQISFPFRITYDFALNCRTSQQRSSNFVVVMQRFQECEYFCKSLQISIIQTQFSCNKDFKLMNRLFPTLENKSEQYGRNGPASEMNLTWIMNILGWKVSSALRNYTFLFLHQVDLFFPSVQQTLHLQWWELKLQKKRAVILRIKLSFVCLGSISFYYFNLANQTKFMNKARKA